MKKAWLAFFLSAVAACGGSEGPGQPDGDDGAPLAFTEGAWDCDQYVEWSYTTPSGRRVLDWAELKATLVDNHDGTLTWAFVDHLECGATYAVDGEKATLLSAPPCRIAKDQQELTVASQASTLTLTSMSTLDVLETWTYSGTQPQRVDGQLQVVAVAGIGMVYSYCTTR